MLLPSPSDDVDEVIAGHEGYVAGRLADGYLTDIWTDVRAHLDGRYCAYIPRCACGWTGPPFSTTPVGYAACRQLWRTKHLDLFLRAFQPREGVRTARWTPTLIQGELGS